MKHTYHCSGCHGGRIDTFSWERTPSSRTSHPNGSRRPGRNMGPDRKWHQTPWKENGTRQEVTSCPSSREQNDWQMPLKHYVPLRSVKIVSPSADIHLQSVNRYFETVVLASNIKRKCYVSWTDFAVTLTQRQSMYATENHIIQWPLIGIYVV